MHKYAVEFLGTLLLVFVVLATGHWAAIGLALALAVYFGGSISGGAFNPAVAFAFYLNRKQSAKDLGIYLVIQMIAAGTAVYLQKMVR